MYTTELKDIVNASKKGTLSIFVGAGVSRVSHAPGWGGLIDKINMELGEKPKGKYDSNELLKIPQIFYYSIDRDDDKYYDFIKREINCEQLEPNIIHDKMLELRPKSFITTNYDDLLEKAASNKCMVYKTVADNKEVSNISGDKYILKIHGDFEHRNIVLKEEDYLNYSENFKMIEILLKSIFSTDVVVFIGYSLSDYNIKIILNWIKEMFKEEFKKPYFIYTDENKLSHVEKIYYESKGVKVIDTNCWASEEDFEGKYLSFFKHLENFNLDIVNSKTEKEAFNLLYNLIKPYRNINALRKNDIMLILGDYFKLDPFGRICDITPEKILTKKFLKLLKGCCEDFKKIDINRLRDINKTFNKAGLNKIVSDDGTINEFGKIERDYLRFYDYEKILKKISSQPKKLENKFEKAYFLYKVGDFENSLKLYKEIKEESFKNENYLLFYFSDYNYKTLINYKESLNGLCDSSDLSIEHFSLENSYSVFDNMPIEFKNDFSFLKDLEHNKGLFYNFFDEQKKCLKTDYNLDVGTIEIGETTLFDIQENLRDYLYFYLENNLLVEHLDLFRKNIEMMLESTLRKYFEGNKTTVSNKIPIRLLERNVELNYIHFISIVEYCNVKTFENFLIKNKIYNLDFADKSLIIKYIGGLIKKFSDLILMFKSKKTIMNSYYCGELDKIKLLAIVLSISNLDNSVCDKCLKFLIDNYNFMDYKYVNYILYFKYARNGAYNEKTINIIVNQLCWTKNNLV